MEEVKTVNAIAELSPSLANDQKADAEQLWGAQTSSNTNDEEKGKEDNSKDDLPMTQILPGFSQTGLRKKRGRPRSAGSPRKQKLGGGKRSRRGKGTVEATESTGETVEDDALVARTSQAFTVTDGKENQIEEATKRSEFVVSWLYKLYEASETTSIPRSTVFSKYVADSEVEGMSPVNPATFGKMIRAVFPGLRTRRLGTRGNSKYHYFGIAPAGRGQALAGDALAAATAALVDGVVEGEPRKKGRLPLRAEQHLRNRKVHGEAAHLRDQMARGEDRQQMAIPLPLTAAPSEILFDPLIPDFDEFARFVQQICQPISEKLLGSSVSPLLMQGFSNLYQNHVAHMLKLISARDFHLVEMALGMFWSSLPQDLWPCLLCDEGIRIISIADDYLFQVAIHILVPDVLEPLPLAVAQSTRVFAKSLDMWMGQIFDPSIPITVVSAKLDVSRRFSQVLRRRTALNHLAQAVRTILGSTEHVHGMLHDFGNLDFYAIQEQLHWVLPGQGDFVAYVEASLRNHLFEGASIQQWARWLESMLDQSITADVSVNVDLEVSSRNIILRWSLLTSMIMRDMTLRSANSFGSYHLHRLFMDEYVMFYLEKKLDEHRRAMGLLAYWPPQPAQQQQQQQQQADFGYESVMAGFASMDELFRKSGLLAYSQQTYATAASAASISTTGE